MAIQSECDGCNEYYPSEQLIHIKWCNKLWCEHCINDYIEDLKQQRDDYSRKVDMIQTAMYGW